MLETTENRKTYNGNGVTDTFSFPYYFLETSDLMVYVDGVLKTITTHYTVTGAGSEAGGTVVFTAGNIPASGTGNVVIVREVPYTQETDYPSGDKFPSASHERALDKLTMLVQRLKDLSDRSIGLSDSESASVSLVLPTPEANKVLGWNAASPWQIQNKVLAEGLVAITEFMSTLLDDTSASEARTTLGAAASNNAAFTGTFTVSQTSVVGSYASGAWTGASQDTAQAGFAMYQYGTSAPFGLVGYKSRGSFSGSTDSQAGDLINQVDAFGWNNSGWRRSSRIIFEQQTYGAGVGYVPGTIRFYTTNLTGTEQEQLRIYSDGTIATAGQAAAAGYTNRGDITLPFTSKVRAVNTAKAIGVFQYVPANLRWEPIAGFNVGIPTWTGASPGVFRINFTNALPYAEYAVQITAKGIAATNRMSGAIPFGAVRTTTYVDIEIYRDDTGALSDPSELHVVIM